MAFEGLPLPSPTSIGIAAGSRALEAFGVDLPGIGDIGGLFGGGFGRDIKPANILEFRLNTLIRENTDFDLNFKPGATKGLGVRFENIGKAETVKIIQSAFNQSKVSEKQIRTDAFDNGLDVSDSLKLKEWRERGGREGLQTKVGKGGGTILGKIRTLERKGQAFLEVRAKTNQGSRQRGILTPAKASKSMQQNLFFDILKNTPVGPPQPPKQGQPGQPQPPKQGQPGGIGPDEILGFARSLLKLRIPRLSRRASIRGGRRGIFPSGGGGSGDLDVLESTGTFIPKGFTSKLSEAQVSGGSIDPGILEGIR